MSNVVPVSQMILNNYMLEFCYVGPKMEIIHDDCPEADIALRNAEKQILEIAHQCNLSLIHEYAMPDGSLFKSCSCSEHEIVSFLNFIGMEAHFIKGVYSLIKTYVPIEF